MKRNLFVMAAFIAQFSFGQNYVYQVYVLKEGYYDYQTSQQLQPVTLGAYNPQTQVYSVVDTLENARFGSDLLVTEMALYVAADQQILKYDKFIDVLRIMKDRTFDRENIVREGRQYLNDVLRIDKVNQLRQQILNNLN